DLRTATVATREAEGDAGQRLPAHGERVHEPNLDRVGDGVIDVGRQRRGLAEAAEGGAAGVDQQVEPERQQAGGALDAAPDRDFAHGRATDGGNVAPALDHVRL